jgi:hypothetical protein
MLFEYGMLLEHMTLSSAAPANIDCNLTIGKYFGYTGTGIVSEVPKEGSFLCVLVPNFIVPN